MHRAIPFLWYMAGSLCFVMGSAITLYRIWKGE